LSAIIENFLKISEISRCSYHTKPMQDFLVYYSKMFGYEVETDESGNVLATTKNPKLTLQAHYDMVCVGDVANMQIEVKNGRIYSKNSSLGADNGMAIAMMMEFMKSRENVEFLFTNNEEVGLIGAIHLDLKIRSDKVLNLDSEEEGLVFIGCAGGVDFNITKDLKSYNYKDEVSKISVSNLPGGHSGVDIDKDIDNAILKLLQRVKREKSIIHSFEGGVATNAIPANAKAIVSNSYIKKYDEYSKEFIDDILSYHNGVLERNNRFKVVETSNNIGLLKIANNKLNLQISLRSLDNTKLDKASISIANYWRDRGYSVQMHDKYPAWKPEMNEFTNMVKQSLEKEFHKSKEMVIHAGLECGILAKKFPHAKFASIGPNIYNPHSVREIAEIESIEKTFKCVKDIIDRLGWES